MINTNLLGQDNYQDLTRFVKDRKRVWLIQVVGNIYFLRYFIEDDWVLRDISDVPYAFRALLFEKLDEK